MDQSPYWFNFHRQNRGTFNRIYCGEISRHALNTNNSGAGGGGGGGKTKLLEQKIPATYLALEDLIGFLSAELRGQGHDPVLNRDQFSEAVNREMEARFGLKFRDEAELSQATKFLHENGLMLHYDDATLRDLYFLDPQWLCDVLSHVVTIREINPFAKNGIMRLEDLRHVFKSSSEFGNPCSSK